MHVIQRIKRTSYGLALALGAFCVSAVADDTEIYLTPPNPDPEALPLVMLSLDYRPSLGATICTDTQPGKCRAADYFRSQGLEADLPASGKLNFYEMLQITLKLVLGKYPNVQIGLMLNHNHNEGCAGPTYGSGATGDARCSNGGYIARGFRLNDATNRNELLGILKAIPLPQGNTSHPYQGKELFFELYRYLRGGDVYNGHNGWTDYATSKNFNINDPSDGSSDKLSRPPENRSTFYDWDTRIESSDFTRYTAPAYKECTSIYTINFMFAVSQQESDSDAAIRADFGIDPGTSNSGFPTVLGYLNETDLVPEVSGKQNVTSFFLVKDVEGLLKQTQPYAQRGGTGSPLAVTDDPAQLEAVLDNVFSQILSVSTTFVAASVPVNVFNRSQAVDNVYLALFQAEKEPRWNGCLKKLRVKRSNAGTILVDSLNDFTDPADTTSAFGATDGRIRFDARTFWTDDSGDFMNVGDTNSDGIVDNRDGSDKPVNPPDYVTKRDGRIVARGGAGQNIPGFKKSVGPGLLNSDSGSRKLFYDAATTPASLAPLNADAATAATLAPSLKVPYSTVAERTAALELLKYVRGFDNGGPAGLGDGNNATVGRDWQMGDPLHSRPQPINYGSIAGYEGPTATPPMLPPPNRRPGIFIAVAGNDGYLRFIENTKPNQGPAPTSGDAEPLSVQSGREVWAFMPRAAMGAQKFLKTNEPIATDSGHPNYDAEHPDRPFSPHPYTLDGAPTVLVKDINGNGTIESGSGDRVYLYVGMRRGGRNYYALDVTDPYAPSLLWTITGGSGSFAELGYTFSQPRTGRVRVGTQLRDVLFFAGGYDNSKDYKKLGDDDKLGNAIYVVDAVTGQLIWKATGGDPAGNTATHKRHPKLVDSIPADLAAVDMDGDTENLIDRLLVGDTGGNVWRVDLAGSDTSKWNITQLASLGRHFSNDIANDRRFLNRVDVVQDSDATGKYDAVILGSGDREDPLDVRGSTSGEVTTNWFYVIKDRKIGVGTGTDSTLDHAGLPDITRLCAASAEGESPQPCTPPGDSGWKLQLAEAPGEKNLSPALTVSGTIFFTTYLKANSTEEDSCGPSEGSGLLYAVKLASGAPAYDFDVVGDAEGDRTQPLGSGGIPSQPVYLPPLEPCQGASCPVEEKCADDDELCKERKRCEKGGDVILPDGSVQKVCPLPARPTFWRRRAE